MRASRQTAKANPTGKRNRPSDRRGKCKNSSSKSTAPTQLEPLVPPEVEQVHRKLFESADNDKSGTIQFVEFLKLHKAIMRVVGDAIDAFDASPEETEKKFRSHDTNHDGSLDYDELVLYMDGLMSVLGKRSFLQTCNTTLEEIQLEKQSKRSDKWQYDAVSSDRLLVKIKNSNDLEGQANEELSELIKRKADVNFVDQTDSSVLYYAAEKCTPGLCLMLLKAGADPNHCNKELECAAFTAARGRNRNVIRLVMLPEALGESPPDEENNQTTLSLSKELIRNMPTATAAGVRDILNKKADLSYKEETGWTALSFAVFWGKLDCVETILRHNQHNKNSRFKMDTPDSKGRTALHIAIRKGRLDIVRPIIANKANLESKDCDGWTSLHHATFNGADECVVELIKQLANPMSRTDGGFTAHMVAMMPSSASVLSQESLKLIEPSSHIQFSKSVLPLLQNTELSFYDKLEAIITLPGVNYALAHARLYEQCFHVKTGPSKVRITKIWNHLGFEAMRRLRTCITDMTPLKVDASVEARRAWTYEHERRLQNQQRFIEQWMLDSMGPPPSPDFPYNARDGTREDIMEIVVEELKAYRIELDGLYAEMRKTDFGAQLCSGQHVEIFKPKSMLQTNVHPILPWLESCNMLEAFDALRVVQALGMGKDDSQSLSIFADLLVKNDDFSTGQLFWSNVYRLWLVHYAAIAQLDFNRKVHAIVGAFNDAYESSGLKASVRVVPSKRYDRLKEKEKLFAAPTTDQHKVVAGQVLDIIRASIVVNSAEAAVRMVNEYLRTSTIIRNRMEVVRIVNNFHESAKTDGYRDVVINMVYNGGCGVAPCGRPNKSLTVSCVGEVQVVLEDFIARKKRMHLLTKFAAGDFEHKPYCPLN